MYEGEDVTNVIEKESYTQRDVWNGDRRQLESSNG